MLLRIPIQTDYDGERQVLLNPESIGLVEAGPDDFAMVYVEGRDRPLKFAGTVEVFEALLTETYEALCGEPPASESLSKTSIQLCELEPSESE